MKNILLTLGLLVSVGQITAMGSQNNDFLEASLIASNILIIQQNVYQEKLLHSAIERYPASYFRLEPFLVQNCRFVSILNGFIGLSISNINDRNYEKAFHGTVAAAGLTLGRELAIRYAIDHLEQL